MREPGVRIENTGKLAEHSWHWNPTQRWPRFAIPLLETYACNDAMNQLILSELDPRAWRAQPPGEKGSGRTIAAIFAHLHNCRLVWLKNSAPHLKCPAPLDPDGCTMKQPPPAHKEKRRAVPANVDGCSLRPLRIARCKVLSRQLDANMARRSDHVRLHVFTRGASSRPDSDAGHQAGYRVLHKTLASGTGEALEKAGLTTRPH